MTDKFTIKLFGLENLYSERTLVMGIMNATPDSFSDGGDLSDYAIVKSRAQEMIDAGVDIIDVGGESTRPGHQLVSIPEELERIQPVIEAIRAVSKKIPISIDTRRAEVASFAIEKGANFVNDVSGLSDEAMVEVVKEADCSIVLMQGFESDCESVTDCNQNLKSIVSKALSLGLAKTQIVVDPGIGFVGPDPELNMELIRQQTKYNQDLPVLIGASRKRFIGQLTGQDLPKHRIMGSVAVAVVAAEHGASIVRVHDVAETIKALRVVNK